MDKKKKIIAFALALLVIAGIILYVIFVPTSSLTRVEGELNSRQEARLLREISELIVVPQDEEPVIAYVTNAPQLRIEQPFYSGVKNGDFIVLFPISQKAVIYDPVGQILVNVGPVQVTPTDPQIQQNSTIEQMQQDIPVTETPFEILEEEISETGVEEDSMSESELETSSETTSAPEEESTQ